MERFSFLPLFVFVLSVALDKDLHMKEYYIEQDLPVQAFNLNIYDNFNASHSSHNERFVRHLKVQAVTETLISHLFNEIRNRDVRDPRMAKDPNLRKMMKNLKLRLKKYMHNKKPHMKKMRKATGKLKHV